MLALPVTLHLLADILKGGDLAGADRLDANQMQAVPGLQGARPGPGLLLEQLIGEGAAEQGGHLRARSLIEAGGQQGQGISPLGGVGPRAGGIGGFFWRVEAGEQRRGLPLEILTPLGGIEEDLTEADAAIPAVGIGVGLQLGPQLALAGFQP